MPISTIPAAGLSSGVPTRAQLPAGCILQVASANKTDTFTLSSQTWTDIPGLSVSITPTSSNSRILITASVAIGASSDFAYIRLLRNSTVINVGDAAGNRPRVTGAIIYPNEAPIYVLTQVPVTFVDSPSTTIAVTYKFQLRVGASGTAYINRTNSDRDTVDYEWRTPSNIILMEIAG